MALGKFYRCLATIHFFPMMYYQASCMDSFATAVYLFDLKAKKVWCQWNTKEAAFYITDYKNYFLK